MKSWSEEKYIAEFELPSSNKVSLETIMKGNSTPTNTDFQTLPPESLSLCMDNSKNLVWKQLIAKTSCSIILKISSLKCKLELEMCCNANP